MAESKSLINWRCKYCGMSKASRTKPLPGMCLRRPKKGNMSQPHSWSKQ